MIKISRKASPSCALNNTTSKLQKAQCSTEKQSSEDTVGTIQGAEVARTPQEAQTLHKACMHELQARSHLPRLQAGIQPRKIPADDPIARTNRKSFGTSPGGISPTAPPILPSF